MNLRKIYKQGNTVLGLRFDTVVIFSIYSLSVLIPLVIGNPQLLVGSAINFLITYSTLKYGIKKTVPVLLLPSITVTITGILFDGATHFLIYVMPFIMISNLIFAFFISKEKNFSYILAILLKGSFLFVSFIVMNKVVGLPNIFISSVYMQYITASIGLIAALGIVKSLDRVK